ncbi:MAG TPA: hypothetical protein VK179_19515 [Bacteroidales bacterium]|nr:hypothetical protein [Bacteroidales bacterium]
MTNRLITTNNVAFSREDLMNAERKNVERMVLIEKRSESNQNNAETSAKTYNKQK